LQKAASGRLSVVPEGQSDVRESGGRLAEAEIRLPVSAIRLRECGFRLSLAGKVLPEGPARVPEGGNDIREGKIRLPESLICMALIKIASTLRCCRHVRAGFLLALLAFRHATSAYRSFKPPALETQAAAGQVAAIDHIANRSGAIPRSAGRAPLSESGGQHVGGAQRAAWRGSVAA